MRVSSLICPGFLIQSSNSTLRSHRSMMRLPRRSTSASVNLVFRATAGESHDGWLAGADTATTPRLFRESSGRGPR